MLDRFQERLADYAPNLFYALIIFIVGYIVIRLIVKFLKTVFSRSHLEETGWSFLVSLIRAVLYVILAVMILSQLQVPMSSIIATLGTAGLAIGLALKESLSNVAGGFIIMFTRPFKSGDYVEIKGSQGTVSRISILYTKLLTMDNKCIMIPNGTVASSTITNYTQEELRRLELTFDISYANDFRAAEEAIANVVAANSFALDKPDAPFIRMCEHSANSVKILLRVWVKSENYWELRYALLADVKDAFDRENIEIPYNQLDVHLDKN